MPVYNDTPLATNPINQTQAPIRTNFDSIEQLIDINHVDFSDPVNFGKHNVTQFVPQVNTPLMNLPTFIPGILASEFNIYNTIPNGTAVLTGVPNQGYPVTLTSNELILERAAVAPQTLNTFTPITATATVTNGTGIQGWAFLPSGILLKWGYIFEAGSAIDTNTYKTFSYPTSAAIPVFNNVWSISITSTSSINGVQIPAGTPPQVLTMLGDYTNTTINIFSKALGVFGNPGRNDWTYFSMGTAQLNV